MRTMHGIVLGIEWIFLIFIRGIRKVKIKLVYKKKIAMLVCIAIFFMALYITYLFFAQSTYMYVREHVVENLFSEKSMEEAENVESTGVEKDLVKDLNISKQIDKIISSLWDNRDIICTAIVIIISIIIYLFRNIIVFAPYCEYVKKQLYELKHCWLGGKSLKSLLVSVSVWQEDNNYEQDICKYFMQKLEKPDPDRYIILGNPGEGKTVSVRKLGNMLLDTRFQVQKDRKSRVIERVSTFVKNNIMMLGSSKYIPVIFNVVDIKRINTVEELEGEIKDTIYSESRILKSIRKIEQIKKSIYYIIEKNMEKGRLVVFFDGFDEVSAESSYYLKNIIFKLQEKYPKCFYVFSSRTAVFYERSDMQFDNEKILKLLPFSKQKILIFLKKWKFKREEECWDLYGKILCSYQLERLAGNPLLLTLIAYLYEHSELNEPKSIADFYQMAITCLLDKWEDEKKILKRTKVDLDIKCIFLERTAYWLFEHEETFFKKIDLFKAIGDINQYGIELNTIYNEIYRYSGILEKTKGDNYKFRHRSFYEYFVASYLVSNQVDVLNDQRYISNFQIMFFYLSLKKDSTITEYYIKNYLQDDALVDKVILECKIDNPRIIRFYFLKKKWSKKRHDEEYYTVLGWIAEKYSNLKRQIEHDLLEEFAEARKCNRKKQIIYILQAFSRFKEPSEVADLIMQYIDQINILDFTRYSSMQLEPCVIELFLSAINDRFKVEIIEGLLISRKYNTILSILNKECSEKDKSIIFSEMLFETKDKLFIQWFDKQDIWKYIDKKGIKQVKKWEKLYGWRWQSEDIEARRKRYLLVYYLLNTDRIQSDVENIHRNNKISNRIKFIASYIKNMENSDSEVQTYFVDIPGYRVVSTEEFRVHWKKENLKEKLLFNPVAINWIQYGVGLLLLLIMCM